MSYLFKDSGYPGYDICVSTKKSDIKGVIVPYATYHLQNGIKEKIAGYNVYTVHHSPEKEHLATHISNGGFVNRFGLFFTKQEIPEGHENDVEIGNGWFTRKNVNTYDEIERILQSLFKIK